MSGMNLPRRDQQALAIIASAQIAERWNAYYARGPESMRREPRHEDDGATVAARRKIHNQKVNDASLLLWFARKARGPKVTQKYRCGKCYECMAGDCGECASCRDKVKFGGRGLRKQACLSRRCVNVGTSKRASA